MKILIVSQYFWPEVFRINELAAGLQARGHEVTVLTGLPNYPEGRFFKGYNFFTPRKETYQGIKIVRVPLLPRGSNRKFGLIMNYLSYVFFGCLLGSFYCRGHYDLIFVAQYSPFTVGIPAVLLKWLKKVPLMFWVQDLWPESLIATHSVHSGLVLKAVTRMVRFIYRQCDRILVQSKGFIPNVASLGAEPEKILYFPNWAGEARLDKFAGPSQPIAGLPEGFRLVFAGNIGVAQDFETILAAMEQLDQYPDIHLVVVGEGRQGNWVKKQLPLQGLTNKVHLIGQRPITEMPAYFAAADALLVTLKAEPIFALTIPTKVQSYLACGKPIIAALNGEGAKVIVEAGAGLTCPSSDAIALAGIIKNVYKMSAQERENMGAKGKKYYQNNFDYSRLIIKLEEYINELCRKEQSCA